MDRITVPNPEVNPGNGPCCREPVLLRRGETGYPAWLEGLGGEAAPATLSILGNPELLRLPMVGVAGAREASETGIKVTTEYVRLLATRGINIVSGHAAGVDLAAHRASLAAGGVTTVVPAEGLNSFKLCADLRPALEDGRLLIVSPFPPGVGWQAWRAIRRNRFIVGLSHAVLVIESGNAGGTFQAAQAARELKRPLFVILYGGTIAFAKGNRYFLEHGARPVGRTLRLEPDLAELLETVRHQHCNGHPPWEPPVDTQHRSIMDSDRRLIEDYLPIEAIGNAASGEPRTKGHISTLHLWRARRPLVACRAAVFGALVQAARFRPANGPEEHRESLTRANAAKFIKGLCQYPGPVHIVAEAERMILESHAQRLSRESGQAVTIQEIRDGLHPRPRVLDLFAGGGAIPLEALRLGCESHALDLNPVAHVIELCTLVYPQAHGKAEAATFWRGLATEVRRWGLRIAGEVEQAVAEFYPGVPAPGTRLPEKGMGSLFDPKQPGKAASGLLKPIAYLWARTVRCPNTNCRGHVPLYRNTWLRKKNTGCVALKPAPDLEERRVRFQVVQAATKAGLGFDPDSGMRGTATDCPFCRTAISGDYVREFGNGEGYGRQLMCVIAGNPHGSGKLYLADEHLAFGEDDRQLRAERLAQALEVELGITSLDEAIRPTGNAGLATGKSYLYGIKTFRQAFTPRQRLVLLTMAKTIRAAHQEMLDTGMADHRAKAVTTYMGLWLSRSVDRFNGLSRWNSAREVIQGMTDMKRFAMTWDHPEVNLFGGASGDALGNLEYITSYIERESTIARSGECRRGSATEAPYPDDYFDAVITDPPYYDNESYAELSDVNYVWMQPAIGFLYPEHFATALTPTKKEVVAASYRKEQGGGGKEGAYRYFESALQRALEQAQRVLKPGAPLVMVYAHKTTLGWSTLVEGIRRSGFEIREAWPITMETKARVAHQEDAALNSNIFLVARKRGDNGAGAYETVVRPELETIVRERVDTLWKMGIVGGDLVIAAVGAGLRAFTRYARVELANGDEVPAERFLAEVEGVVLEQLLEKIFGVSGGVSGVDGPTRFYVLWRYAHQATEMESGEAIVFTYGQNVELDGPDGLSSGARALLEKKKNLYRLRDFSERGQDEQLGQPEGDTPAPAIDVLHRLLWLLENAPRKIAPFLDETQPNRDRLRMIAQALSGAALSGKKDYDHAEAVVTTSAEHAALTKLLANWRVVVEQTGRGLFG